MMGHLGDLAQLYALGVLEPGERLAVEAHLRACGRCSAEVGRAEATVVALTDATIPLAPAPARLGERIAASASLAPQDGRTPPRSFARFRGWYAIAAAFVLGIALAGAAMLQNVQLRHGLADDDLAFATIARSHFRHTNFAGSLPAKVLYARDGSWAYVIVDAPDCRCRIVERGGNGARDLGPPHKRGKTATLLVPAAGRPQFVTLVGQQGEVLATAALVY